MTVNKAALLEWVQELETTDKPQAKRYLNVVGQGYCCLGIACEVFADRLGLVREEVDSLAGPVITYEDQEGLSGKALLPDAVASLLGTDCGSIQVTYEGHKVDVTMLNDSIGLSFKEIAALIRKEYDL